MRDDSQQLQFFDLIAREWQAPGPVQQVTFNANRSAVAFACEGGAVAIATTADTSPPRGRVRRAIDTSQLSIQQREGNYPGLKLADHPEGRTSAIASLGDGHFLFGRSNGRINSVTPGGLCVHLPPKAGGQISAVAEAGGVVAYAVGAEVQLWHHERDAQLVSAPAPVTCLRFSPDGQYLAIGHAAGVLLWSTLDLPSGVAFDASPHAIEWSDDGRWLACSLGRAGLALIDMRDLSCRIYDHFPGPVTSAGFGANTVVASGAYRVAAWSLDDGAAMSTGKSGLVLVDVVAVNAARNLVAVGYANGLLSLCQIGGSAEILLRQDMGVGVSALAWSTCGRFLGVGGRDGSAALVEFPDEMFKS
ncbi:MAG: WD40 repeat domain-containing protein [Paracoccaceae bacterium]